MIKTTDEILVRYLERQKCKTSNPRSGERTFAQSVALIKETELYKSGEDWVCQDMANILDLTGPGMTNILRQMVAQNMLGVSRRKSSGAIRYYRPKSIWLRIPWRKLQNHQIPIDPQWRPL